MHKLSALLIGVLLWYGSAAAEEPIRLMTEEFPPFQYYEGERLTGISIDIIQELQKRIGNSAPIQVYPWTRGLRLLERKPNSALFSTMKTPDRASKFKWVGPLAELRMVFFKKKGSAIQLKSMEDAKKVAKIGVTKNVGAHELLVGFGFSNLDVLETGADEGNIRKLIRGRVDLWPSPYPSVIFHFVVYEKTGKTYRCWS